MKQKIVGLSLTIVMAIIAFVLGIVTMFAPTAARAEEGSFTITSHENVETTGLSLNAVVNNINESENNPAIVISITGTVTISEPLVVENTMVVTGGTLVFEKSTAITDRASAIYLSSTAKSLSLATDIVANGEYGINFDSATNNASVIVASADITAYLPVRVNGVNNSVNVSESNITAHNIYSGANDDTAAIVVVGENNTVTVNSTSITASKNDGCTGMHILHIGSKSNVISVATSVTVNDKATVNTARAYDYYRVDGMIENAGKKGYTNFYYSFEEAVENSVSGDTVNLLWDTTVSTPIIIPAEKDITIDLQGNKITAADVAEGTNHAYAITNNGTLTLRDSKGDSTGDGVADGIVSARGIYNNGTMTIENGIYNGIDSNGGAAIYNYGTVTINGGVFTGAAYTLNNQSNAKMTINNATVTGNGGIYNNGTELIVNGGTFTATGASKHGIYAYDSNVTINGGTFTHTGTTSNLYPAGTTTMTVNGGEFTVAEGYYIIDSTDSPVLNIAGGTITGMARFNASMTTNITGGELNLASGTYLSNTATLNVTGGKFDDNGLKFVVANTNVVAMVYNEVDGTYSYNSDIRAAFYNNRNNENVTITLLTDIETADQLTVSNKITLDLNGHTLKSTYDGAAIYCYNYSELVIKDSVGSGKIVAKVDGVKVGGGSRLATLTIESGSIEAENTGVSISSSSALNVNGGSIDGGTFGVALGGDNGKLTVTGGTITGETGISSHSAYSGTEINISGGTVEGTVLGIYHPQNGTLNISGGTVTGQTGIAVKSGTINVTGGTVSGTGEKADYVVTAGFTSTGDAIVIESANAYNSAYETPTVTISGGEFESTNASAVASYSATESDTAVTEFVTGGTFAGDLDTTLVNATKAGFVVSGNEIFVSEDNEELAKVASNSTDVVAMVMEGEHANYYNDLATAIEKANASDKTITLCKDITLTATAEKLVMFNDLTVDLGTKTINVRGEGVDSTFTGTTTFKNGTINIDSAVATGDAMFCIGEAHGSTPGTLNLTDINLVGENYNSAYAVLYVANNGSALNISGGSIVLKNELYSAGGVIKTDGALETNNNTVTITGTKMDFDNVGRGFVGTDLTLDSVELTVKNSEHGINGAELEISNSTIDISNNKGRGITLYYHDAVITNSTVTMANNGDGDDTDESDLAFKEAGKNVSIDEKSSFKASVIYSAVENDSTITSDGKTYVLNSGVAVVKEANQALVITADNQVVNYVAKVTDAQGNEVYYDSIKTAAACATAGSTVTLVGNATVGNNYDSVIFENAGQYTLDLNGYTLSQKITSNGLSMGLLTVRPNVELTVKDSVGGGKISATKTAVQLQGTLILESGTIATDVEPTQADIEADFAYPIWIYVKTASDPAPSFIMKGGALAMGETQANFTLDNAISVDEDWFPENYTGEISISISAGSVTGNFALNDCTKATVTGGTFTADVSAYVSEDLGLMVNDNGEYEVKTIEAIKESDYVANIGKIYYKTLADAIAAAVAEDTITLLKDATVESVITISEKITLDLGGNTVTATAGAFKLANGANVVVKNGTVESAKDAFSMDVYPDGAATLELAESLTVKAGWNAVYIGGNATLVTAAKLYATGSYAVIQGNGTRHGTTITINGGEIVHESDTAIYHPQNGTLTVNSGTIKGVTGIEMRNGTLNVNGGEIVATGAFSANANGNGTTVTGAAIAISDHNTEGSATVTVNGGKLNGAYAIYETAEFGNDTENTLSVKGGEFSGNVVSETVTEFITAGTFNTAVAENAIASNSGIVVADGNYVVKSVEEILSESYVAHIGKIYYTSITEAIAAAKDGDTVTLDADLSDIGNIKLPANVTFDGNNKTISGNSSITMSKTGESVVKNTNFKNIKNTAKDLSAIYLQPTDSAEKVITNNTFDTVDWDAIQVATADSVTATVKVVISDNTFSGTAKRYIHVEGYDEIIDLTISGNKMLGLAEGVEGETPCSIGVWYFDAEESKVVLSNNYVSNLEESGAVSVVLGSWREYDAAGKDFSKLSNVTANYANTFVDKEGMAITYQAVVVNEFGATFYTTVADAISAAANGEEVKIAVAGTYKLPGFSGKNITITGAVDGVVFDNGGAVTINNSKVTFNNVKFDYYPNVNYTGLQTGSEFVYNYVTFDGQVFLYGSSEIFNNCTFNQTSSDAYNVWTYAAKYVEFNKCTFNSAGKSVLVYNEGYGGTDLSVKETTFNASQTVADKAAIEIDDSLLNQTGDEGERYNITIDQVTTATGFGTNTTSGSSLYNHKFNGNGVQGIDTSVTIVDANGVVVETPITYNHAAKIGTETYRTLADAIDEANELGTATITLLKDVSLTKALEISGNVTLDLAGKTVGFDSSWVRNSGNDALLVVKRGGTLTVNDTVGGGVIDGSTDASKVYAAVKMTNYGEAATGDAATLVVNGGTLKGYYYGISGNGGRDNTNITINGGAVEGVVFGIYQPQQGELAITGGTVKGQTAIVFKSGNLSISGGNIIATAEEQQDYDFKASGAMVTGAALQIENVGGSTGYQEIGTISITGGKFESACGLTVASYAATQTNPNATVKTEFITGGEFASLDKAYISENVTAVVAANGLTTVGAQAPDTTDCVARINNVYYATLEQAIDKAVAEDTVTLLKDATVESVITISKQITLDLGGNTVTATADAFKLADGANVIVKNGTVKATGDAFSMDVYANGGTAKLALESDLTVEAGVNAVYIGGNATLTVNGAKLTSTSDRYAVIQGNGNKHGTTITINENSVIEGTDYAIYHPQQGTLTVNGGTIKGITGIEMRNGTLTVNGGEITATAEFSTNANASGATVKGAAIAVSDHNTEGAPSVTIKGGTFNGAYALYETSAYGGNTGTNALSVTGGTFSGKVETLTVDGYIAGPATFTDSDIDVNDLAEGYGFDVQEDGSLYSNLIATDNAVAHVGKYYYAKLEDAIAAAKEGETVTLHNNVTLTQNLVINKNITITSDEGQTFTVSGGVLSVEGSGVEVVVYDVAKVEVAAEAQIALDGAIAYYSDIETAVANAANGATVTLLDDAVVEDIIVIENKSITIEGNNTTITGTAKKVFEIHNTLSSGNAGVLVTVKNVKIVVNSTANDGGRAFDTRNDEIALTLESVEIDSTGSKHNQQPITIGGYDTEKTAIVTVKNSTITAGASGYGIISFVPSVIYVENSAISGYAAIYMKDGSTGSTVGIKDSTINVSSTVAAAGNAFAAIVSEDDGVKFTVENSTITLSSVENAPMALVVYNGVKDNNATFNGITVTGAIEDYVVYGTSDATANTTAISNSTINAPVPFSALAPTQVMLVDDTLTVNVVDKSDAENKAEATITVGAVQTFNSESAVAEVGTYYFTSLEAAIAFAKAGDVIILTKNVDLDSAIVIDKAISIDLNGNTVVASGTAFKLVDGATVSVVSNATAEGNVEAGVDAFSMASGSELYLDKNVYVYAKECAVFIKGEATLVTEATLYVDGNFAAIQGNGTEANWGTNITINGGYVVSENDVAIYHPQNGTLTVNEGVICGTTGIEMRNGTLTVNGGHIYSVSDFVISENGNGSTVIGAAIAISDHHTTGNAKVTINNGVIAALTIDNDAQELVYNPKGYALYETNAYGDGVANEVMIEGGMFIGAIYADSVTEFINGGAFSDNTFSEEYLVANFMVAFDKNANGLYEVITMDAYKDSIISSIEQIVAGMPAGIYSENGIAAIENYKNTAIADVTAATRVSEVKVIYNRVVEELDGVYTSREETVARVEFYDRIYNVMANNGVTEAECADVTTYTTNAEAYLEAIEGLEDAADAYTMSMWYSEARDAISAIGQAKKDALEAAKDTAWAEVVEAGTIDNRKYWTSSMQDNIFNATTIERVTAAKEVALAEIAEIKLYRGQIATIATDAADNKQALADLATEIGKLQGVLLNEDKTALNSVIAEAIANIEAILADTEEINDKVATSDEMKGYYDQLVIEIGKADEEVLAYLKDTVFVAIQANGTAIGELKEHLDGRINNEILAKIENVQSAVDDINEYLTTDVEGEGIDARLNDLLAQFNEANETLMDDVIAEIKTLLTGDESMLAEIKAAITAAQNVITGATDAANVKTLEKLYTLVEDSQKAIENLLVSNDSEDDVTSIYEQLVAEFAKINDAETGIVATLKKEITTAITNNNTTLKGYVDGIKAQVETLMNGYEIAEKFETIEEQLAAIKTNTDKIDGYFTMTDENGETIGAGLSDLLNNIKADNDRVVSELTEVVGNLLSTQLTSITKAITAAKDDLIGAANDDEAALTLKNLFAKVEESLTKIDDSEKAIKELLTTEDKTGLLDKLQATLDSVLEDTDYLVTNIQNIVVTAVSGMLTAGDLADITSDLNTIKGALFNTDNSNKLDSILSAVSGMSSAEDIAGAVKEAIGDGKDLTAIMGILGTISGTASENNAILAEIQKWINEELKGQITAIANNADTAAKQATAAYEEVAKLGIGTAEGLIEKLQAAVNEAVEAAGRAETAVGELESTIGDVQTAAEAAEAAAKAAETAAKAAEEAAKKAKDAAIIAKAAEAVDEIETWIEDYLNDITAKSLKAVTYATTSEDFRAELETKLEKAYSDVNRALILSYYDQAIAALNVATTEEEITYAVETFKANVALVDVLDTLATDTPVVGGKDDNGAVVAMLVVIVVLVVVIAGAVVVGFVFILKLRKNAPTTPAPTDDEPTKTIEEKEEEKIEATEKVTEEAVEAASEEPEVVEEVVEEQAAEEVTEEPAVVEAEEVVTEEAVAEVAEEEVTEEAESDDDDADDEEETTEETAETEVVATEAAVGEGGEQSEDMFAALSKNRSKTFEERMREADEQTKNNYEEIKDELLSFKKVKSRVSKKCDSFRIGRKLLAKIIVRGKSLKCFLALDPNAYEITVFHHRDSGEKKAYAEVPMTMRVRSPRSLKNVKRLIGDIATQNELIKK